MCWNKLRNIIAYPHGWQFPAITEQHAYERVCEAFPDMSHVLYVGFPWATLIDLLQTEQYDKAKVYQDRLVKLPIVNSSIRITVAQHVYVKRFIKLFENAGITDIFWPHATLDTPVIGNIRIHPFPLFPVQFPDNTVTKKKLFAERKYLYSFIGAYEPKYYLTKSRTWINELPPSRDNFIFLKNEWHYQKAVYDTQIFGTEVSHEKLMQNSSDTQAYRHILEESVFSLCPSGSGPNSIRIWESLGFGCIPVIMADKLKLPGNVNDWKNAAIFIPEEKSSIFQLPERLRSMAADENFMRRCQQSGKLLWEKYGPDDFIHDVVEFSLEKQAIEQKNLQSSAYTSIETHPKISVVIPSFNQAEYLEECIESILSQKYPNPEYIIMDGGSTDGSVKIIKKYEKHLTYWQSKPDGGQYAAINEGFQRSTGEIMTWLNSDDKFHAGALNSVSEIFRERPNVEWIMGRPNGFDQNGAQSWVYDYLPLWSREKYLRKEYRDPYIQQEGTFWRRSLWEKAGGCLRTDMQFAGDLELWTRFFRYAQLHTVDALLAGYRQHPRQKMASFLKQYQQEAEVVLTQEQELFRCSADKSLQPAPPPISTTREIRPVSMNNCPTVSLKNFQEFTYSRRRHFELLQANGINPDTCDLKVIQDLVVIHFILGNIKPGLRLLEIGGGPHSRVIQLLKNRYEIWNIDENIDADSIGYRSIKGLLGEMNPQLPTEYFDCIFSISALEHVPESTDTFERVCRDAHRLLKPGGFSVQSFDIIAKKDSVWTSGLLPFIFLNVKTVNTPVFFNKMCVDPDLYVMSGSAYDKGWRHTTKCSYEEFGRPLAYNVLWQKAPVGLTLLDCSPLPLVEWDDYLQRLKQLWLSLDMITETDSNTRLSRSNLEFWKRIQDKGYFETHPCYGENIAAGDEEETIARYISLQPEMTAVVIGCGYGRDTRFIAPQVRTVYGIDVSSKLLAKATQFLDDYNVHNFCPVLVDHWKQAIPYAIDFVFCVVVFQHLTKDLVRDYIFGLAEKIAPGGKFLCQFAELDYGTSDAELKEYEPSVRWEKPEIIELIGSAGLDLYRLDTIEKPGHGYWHWAFFGKPQGHI